MDSVFDFIKILADFPEFDRLKNVFDVSLLVLLHSETQLGLQNCNLFAGDIVDSLLIEQNLAGIAQQLLLFY